MLRVTAMPAAMLFPWLPKALCHHLHQAMCTLHLDQQLHLQSLRRLAPGTPSRRGLTGPHRAACSATVYRACLQFCGCSTTSCKQLPGSSKAGACQSFSPDCCHVVTARRHHGSL